jgi:hypothetical protein
VEIMQRATSEVDFAHVTLDSPEIHMQLVGPIASLLPISSGAMVFPMVNSRLHVTMVLKLPFVANCDTMLLVTLRTHSTTMVTTRIIFQRLPIQANQFGASNGQ